MEGLLSTGPTPSSLKLKELFLHLFRLGGAVKFWGGKGSHIDLGKP